MKRSILHIIMSVCCYGCAGVAIKEKILDYYYLIASDTDEDLSLSYQQSTDDNNYATIIDATLFAIGYNEKYMVVKQHPRIFPKPPDRTITNYFIIPLNSGFDWRTKNGLIGPLNFD